MALIDVGLDSWILEFDSCEKLSREILENIHTRDKESPGSHLYDSISGKTRVRLKQLSNQVTQLKIKLQQSANLTLEEKERRLRQVEQLQSKYLHLEKIFNHSGANSNRAVPESSVARWGEEDDDDSNDHRKPQESYSSAPIQDVRERQTRMLEAQDRGLAELSQVITRQKRIANVISGEIDDQNAILDDISDNMDRVDTTLRGETIVIKAVGRQDNTCWYWVTIILLLVTILLVAVI